MSNRETKMLLQVAMPLLLDLLFPDPGPRRRMPWLEKEEEDDAEAAPDDDVFSPASDDIFGVALEDLNDAEQRLASLDVTFTRDGLGTVEERDSLRRARHVVRATVGWVAKLREREQKLRDSKG
jgi:hypothetical protein